MNTWPDVAALALNLGALVGILWLINRPSKGD